LEAHPYSYVLSCTFKVGTPVVAAAVVVVVVVAVVSATFGQASAVGWQQLLLDCFDGNNSC
jgi:hypothetical protein